MTELISSRRIPHLRESKLNLHNHPCHRCNVNRQRLGQSELTDPKSRVKVHVVTDRPVRRQFTILRTAIGANVDVHYAGTCVLSITYGKSSVCTTPVRKRFGACVHSRTMAHRRATACGCRPETSATFRIGSGTVSGWSAGDYRSIITSPLCIPATSV